MQKPEDVIAKMDAWFVKRGVAVTVMSRTREQKAWDSAILAASEYVRRMTHDESLAGSLHFLLTPYTKEGE
jgi:hypothetical protein